MTKMLNCLNEPKEVVTSKDMHQNRHQTSKQHAEHRDKELSLEIRKDKRRKDKKKLTQEIFRG